MVTRKYYAWVVEGSNGQQLSNPSNFQEAINFLHQYESKQWEFCSASHPIPNYMVEARKNAKFGYILRRIEVTESWSLK